MRHVAIVLLAAGSLAALPHRAPAQQAARSLAAFTLASGARPSVGQGNPYTALAAAATMAAAAAAPRRLRPWLLGAALAVEAVTVGGSVRNGLPLRIH